MGNFHRNSDTKYRGETGQNPITWKRWLPMNELSSDILKNNIPYIEKVTNWIHKWKTLSSSDSSRVALLTDVLPQTCLCKDLYNHIFIKDTEITLGFVGCRAVVRGAQPIGQCWLFLVRCLQCGVQSRTISTLPLTDNCVPMRGPASEGTIATAPCVPKLAQLYQPTGSSSSFPLSAFVKWQKIKWCRTKR